MRDAGPDADDTAALEAIGVAKSFRTGDGTLEVLRGVDLTLRAGEAVVIMGPSGSGKSTLLNIIGTLERPDRGRLRIGGQDPFDLAEPGLAAFRNRHIGFVFQDHHLLPQCSTLENVLLPTLAGPAAGDALVRARELLERVGLGGRADHRPAALSGGERQRVAVARALVNRPLLVLADEPTGNLDRRTAEAVASLLAELHGEQGATLVVSTHSESLARRFARRYELTDGRLADA